MAKEESWPPLRAYAQDEAGAHNLLDEAVYYYSLLKKHHPDLMTWTDIGGGIAMGVDEIGPLSTCIDIFNTNRFTPEIAKALVARGKPYAIYNGCGATPASTRFFFGFYGYKTRGMQIAQWAYYFGNAIFQDNGVRQEDEGYVYLADDGPLPSVMWEAVREGIDDYRYIHLLAQRIAAARVSEQVGAKQAAENADRVLHGLLGRIGWGFQALDAADRSPPPHPSTLRKWRWQVAKQILTRQPMVGTDMKERAMPDRVSPMELPWAETARRRGPIRGRTLASIRFRGDHATVAGRGMARQGRRAGGVDRQPHRPQIRTDRRATGKWNPSGHCTGLAHMGSRGLEPEIGGWTPLRVFCVGQVARPFYAPHAPHRTPGRSRKGNSEWQGWANLDWLVPDLDS